MAKRPDTTTVSSGFNSQDAINNNFTAITEKFDNTLSLDGSTPNAMNAELDMNSNQITNARDVFINGLGSLKTIGTDAASARTLAEAAAAIAQNIAASYSSNTGGPFIFPADYGATGDGTTDDTTALQNAINAAQASGFKLLLTPELIYRYTSQLFYDDNLWVVGNGAELKKDFTTSGTNAGIQPSSIGTDIDGSDGANRVIFEDVVFSAEDYLDTGVKTNKLLWVNGRNIIVDKCHFKTWSGWACTVGGENIVISNCTWEDCYQTIGDAGTGNGNDGLHLTFGKHIYIHGNYFDPVTGPSDDAISLATPLTGSVSDQDISHVHIFNNTLHSTNSRGLILGVWNSTLTSNVHTITVTGNYIKGASTSNGALSIFSNSTSGKTYNINAHSNYVDNSGSLAGIIFRGIGSDRLRNISIENFIVEGTGEKGVYVIGRTDQLTLTGLIDATNFAGGTATARYAFQVTGPDGSKDFRADLDITAYAGANACQVATGTDTIEGGALILRVTNVGDGFRALNMNAVKYCDIKVVGGRKSGETTTIGVHEGSLCEGNDFSGSVLSNFDTPVNVAQEDSNWVGVVGMIQKGFGGDLTISSGAITVTHEKHRLTAQSGTVDTLTTINYPDNMPDGIEFTFTSVSGDTITIEDGTDNINAGSNRVLSNKNDVFKAMFLDTNFNRTLYASN